MRVTIASMLTFSRPFGVVISFSIAFRVARIEINWSYEQASVLEKTRNSFQDLFRTTRFVSKISLPAAKCQ